MTQELARIETPGALQRAGDINVADLLQQIVKAGVTGESAAAVKELVLLHEHRQDREAKQEFVQAFARVRAKTGRINATHANPAKDGTARWWMATLAEIQDVIEPICRSEGLEVRWDTRREGPQANIVVGVCIVTHTGTGHTEKAEGSVNAANAQGGDAGAATTACRVATIRMFGLRVAHDDNSRILGDLANAEQIRELQSRLKAVGGNERQFVAWALNRHESSLGPDLADAWKQIRQGRLEYLHAGLHQRELKNAGATGRPSESAGGSTAVSPPATAGDKLPSPKAAAVATPAQPPSSESESSRMDSGATGGPPREPSEAEKWAIQIVERGKKSVNAVLATLKPQFVQPAKDAAAIQGKVSDLNDDVSMTKFLTAYHELSTKGTT